MKFIKFGKANLKLCNKSEWIPFEYVSHPRTHQIKDDGRGFGRLVFLMDGVFRTESLQTLTKSDP